MRDPELSRARDEEPWGTGMGWDSVHRLQSISIGVFILPHLLYLFL